MILNKLATVSIILALIIVTSLTTFFTTKHLVFQDAYAKGHAVGFREESTYVPSALDEKFATTAKQDYDQLVVRYNNLSDQYNQLRSVANSNAYQPSSRITCNGMSYGINSQYATVTCN